MPPPGDRHPDIHQVYPPAAFYHNGRGGRVLDVTKPPFNAKGDGVSDDTAALVAALRFVRDHYEILRVGDLAYCTQKQNHNWIVYLPDGEYLVRDTVSQGWPALAMDIRPGWSHIRYFGIDSPAHEEELYVPPAEPPLLHGNTATPAGNDNDGCYLRGQYPGIVVYAENNWAIRVVGQSRDRTVIRLADATPGFGAGAARAVLSLYLLQRGSNVNAGNFVENLTIATGCGNPGAVGLKWNSSNWGGIHNVAIVAGDGRGHAGLVTDANNATGYHHDLLIEGFATGIDVAAGRETMVSLEYATLRGQTVAAIHLGDARAGGGGDNLSARKLLIEDAPVALHAGRAGQAVLLESTIRTRTPQAAAMAVDTDGLLLARNVRVTGYDTVGEWDEPPTIGLAPADAPLVYPATDLADWAAVDDFGAVGDGVTDDTAAVQRAMDSGKPVVWFPRANYVVNGTVDIPATVREVTWLFGTVHRAVATEPDGPALFRVAEPSSEPLCLHQATTAGGVFLDHAADRPVVIEDVCIWFHHSRSYAAGPDMFFPSAAAQDTTIWRLYRNTTPAGPPKVLFVNDSLFFAGDSAGNDHPVENARVWARMVNTENLPGALYSFRRADAWILGFKSEAADTLVQAAEGARVEVFGGTFLNWSPRPRPTIVCRNSQVAAAFLLWHWAVAGDQTIVHATTNGAVYTVPATRFHRLHEGDAAVVTVVCGATPHQEVHTP